MIYKIRCSYPRNFFKLIFLGIPPSYSTLNVSFPIRRMANRTPVCQLNLKGYIILQTKVFQGKRSHFQGIYCSRSIGFSREHHYFHKRTILPSSLHNDTEHGQLTLHNSELPECINPEFSPINFQFLKEISTFHYPPITFRYCKYIHIANVVDFAEIYLTGHPTYSLCRLSSIFSKLDF